MKVLTIYAHHNPRSSGVRLRNDRPRLARRCEEPHSTPHAQKALIIQTTIWDEKSYREAGLEAAMKVLVDEYALRYPGIKRVEHAYFHAVHGADEAMRRAYLDQAYRLGREF